MDLHHPIVREFPEHRETVRRLKLNSESCRLDIRIPGSNPE